MGATKAAGLSQDAMTALMNTGTNRQGSAVPVARGSQTWEELKVAGMIRAGGGLTRAGSIVREREANRLMDQLFPL
jgi:hypothetical protein